MRARLLALLCAAVTLVATLFTAHVSYLCRMTGERQDHCCCVASTSKSLHDKVGEACCERTIERATAQAAVQRGEERLPIAWAPSGLVALVEAPRVLEAQALPLASRARGPPSGPPLYVRDCRFLI